VVTNVQETGWAPQTTGSFVEEKISCPARNLTMACLPETQSD